jgi:hypothetical protein
MSKNALALWFQIVSVILVLFGITYVIFGLKQLPVPRPVLLDWESALYGAVMIGWGVTLVLAGRIAFRRDDAELKRALLAGIVMWLIVEGAASVWFGVWFNVGVDACVMALFAFPLWRTRPSRES